MLCLCLSTRSVSADNPLQVYTLRWMRPVWLVFKRLCRSHPFVICSRDIFGRTPTHEFGSSNWYRLLYAVFSHRNTGRLVASVLTAECLSEPSQTPLGAGDLGALTPP